MNKQERHEHYLRIGTIVVVMAVGLVIIWVGLFQRNGDVAMIGLGTLLMIYGLIAASNPDKLEFSPLKVLLGK